MGHFVYLVFCLGIELPKQPDSRIYFRNTFEAGSRLYSVSNDTRSQNFMQRPRQSLYIYVYTLFIGRYTGDGNLQSEINANRKKLSSIVDTIILCGRLGIAEE